MDHACDPNTLASELGFRGRGVHEGSYAIAEVDRDPRGCRVDDHTHFIRQSSIQTRYNSDGNA